MLQALLAKYKDLKQNSLNKKEFKSSLLQAVSDGKLTKEEIDELNKKKSDFGLTDQDVNKMRVDVYLSAFAATKSDQKITSEEEKELTTIQNYLGLADGDIQSTKQELARSRLLNEIQLGNIPVLSSVPGLVLQKDEKAYWNESAVLNEEKVISRRYEGGSQGVSIRLMKGVSYRVGSQRGHLVSETGIVPVSEGEMVITSKRLVFRSILKSFSINLDKILDMHLYADGLKISEINKQKPRLMQFRSADNQNIIGAILSYAMNHYGSQS